MNDCLSVPFVVEDTDVEIPMGEKHRYELSIVIAAAHELGEDEGEALRAGVERAVQGVLGEDGTASADMSDRRTILLRLESGRRLGQEAEEAFSLAAQEVVVDSLEAGDALRVGRLEPVAEPAAPKF